MKAWVIACHLVNAQLKGVVFASVLALQMELSHSALVVMEEERVLVAVEAARSRYQGVWIRGGRSVVEGRNHLEGGSRGERKSRGKGGSCGEKREGSTCGEAAVLVESCTCGGTLEDAVASVANSGHVEVKEFAVEVIQWCGPKGWDPEVTRGSDPLVGWEECQTQDPHLQECRGRPHLEVRETAMSISPSHHPIQLHCY